MKTSVGLTATNALSDIFEIASSRYGEKRTIRFEEGVKVSDQITKVKPDEHGLSVSFIPSQKYLKKHEPDCQIQYDELISWTEKIMHLAPPNITAHLQVVVNKDKTIKKKLVNKTGQIGLLKMMVDKPLLEPFVIKDLYKFKEFDAVENKELDRYVGLEAAITFISDVNENSIDSYCNFVHTIDGGSHVDSVVNSAVRFFLKETKAKLSERDAKKYEPKRQDVLASLAMSINVLTNTQPEFSGQVKEKVTSHIFTKIFNELGMVYRNLVDYFKENPKQLEKAIDIIKANTKARVKATEVREVEFKKSKTITTDLRKSKKFIQGDVRSIKQYSELLIVEGESASGGIDSERFTFQDAVLLKGVPVNSMKHKSTKVLSNDEIALIVQAMRANVGNKFNIDEAWYDKVILMTDGDSDGNVIFSSMVVFFMLYMRPLVEQGRIYRALPPLYKIKDKKRTFIKSKAEYFEVYVEQVKNNIMIEGDGKLLSVKDMVDFFYANRDYLQELRDLSKYFGVHPFIVEFICKHWGNKKFEKMLTERFPELSVNDDIIEGVYDGTYQYIIVNKRFIKNSKAFAQVLFNETNKCDLYRIYKKASGKNEDLGMMSIGELLTLCEQYSPDIVQRYKGLGEINAIEFRDTVLDPNNRQLVRLTVADYEKALEVLKVLHDDSPKSSAARKELIKSYSIRKDELDN